MRTFDISCGGVSSRSATVEGQTIHMDVQGRARNVKLRIEDISKAMVSNIPAVLLDLLEVAAYVYCADQRAPRGSDKLTDYGRDWRRDMRFKIPVRLPDRWETAAVKDALRETLGFLSDDTYSFSFVKARKPLAERDLYFSNLTDGTFLPDKVALFSGGVDSFAGAVEDLVDYGKNMTLVGHFSASKVFSVQKDLIEGLNQRGFNRQIFYVPVEVTNTGESPREYTQRTRSFLFASLGVVVARMFRKDSFTFYENGVVSINIPVAGDVMGARATRTTHPRVLRGFEAIFSALLERRIEIETPLQWLTKKEVTEKIGKNGFGNLLSKTASCTRPRKWTRRVRHCGICSQCIDRRFAILAAGMGDSDPKEHYGLDLLTGDRSLDNEVRMAIAYVKLFQTIASLPKGRFVSEYPQVTSALAYFSDVSADEATDQIYDLYMRHAQDVLSVIADGTGRHINELVRGELPAGSLLSLCFNRTRIEVSPPSDYDQQVKGFMDRLERPVCEFSVDTEAKRIWFRGGFYVDGANYKIVEALLENFRTGKNMVTEIAYIRTEVLAAKLEMSDASLRQQLRRLRKQIEDRLAVDQGILLGTNDFIENKERSGYRLNPALREVSRVDLQSSSGAASSA